MLKNFNSPVKAKTFTASIKLRLAGQKAFLRKYKKEHKHNICFISASKNNYQQTNREESVVS